MAKQWEESGLKSVWNSLFDASEFSACKENDADLQGVSMLLKKTFYVFEKLKVRCEEAESAQQKPCQRCTSLEKVIVVYKTKLKQTESRMKSIAQILNMGGGLSQEGNSSPGKQQSMAKALTQMLFGEDMEISEDESEPDERGGGGDAKRVKRSPVKRSPVKVIVTAQKRSPVKVIEKKSPVKVIEKRSPVMKVIEKRSPVKVIAPESLCPAESGDSKQQQQQRKTNVVLETLSSQAPDSLDVFFLSDNDETFLEPPATPTRRNATPPSQGKTSPIIRSKAKKSGRLRLDRKDADCSLTSSPPLSGSNKSPFTPRPRSARDKTVLGSILGSPSNEILEALVSTPEVYGSKAGGGPRETETSAGEPTPVSKKSTPSGFVQSLLTTPGLGDETPASLSLLRGPTLQKPKPISDYGQVRSTGSAVVDGLLDAMCDTKPSTPRQNEEETGFTRRQADFWKLKPSASSKEPIMMGNGGQKLKQTKIAFGLHPERTDVCTLSEYNGGVRQSQSDRGSLALREFNGGIRPGQTSTMIVDYADDEAAFERAILNSLADTNTQCLPDREEDFVAPSPDLSLSRRFLSSQRAKQSTSGDVELKENEVTPPDTEELLAEMGAPSLPGRTTELLIRDFDRVPKRHEDVPDYKYQREAVRKRDERMRMEGWDCVDCKNYYAARVNNSAERKQLMDRCSKHRDKYRRVDSPPGYWNPDFPSTPELRARNIDITQKPQQFRTRKRH